MKTSRFFAIAAALCLSVGAMAQNTLTDGGQKAQRALIEYLRSQNIVPKIDTRDNSVNFNRDDVLYWVTFKGEAPVEYTFHRKGLKFDDSDDFSLSCARLACNEVNQHTAAKATVMVRPSKDGKTTERRVQFKFVSYAKEPSDFHGGFRAMLSSFKNIEDNWKKAYADALKELKEKTEPIKPKTVTPGASPLKATAISFANVDAAGNFISDWDQPLRKSDMRFIKTSVEVTSGEKGLYKLGVKIYNPDKRLMVATKGMEYATTSNIEIKKTDKPAFYEMEKYGDETPDFWKAGEYKVEVYDFEKGALIYNATFNIL